MKFKIKEYKKAVSEVEVELSLEGDGEKEVKLIAENNKGQKRTIMRFLNGKFTKIDYADMKGIETDGAGKIIEE